MLAITVVNDKQNQQLDHEAGPLEFGRGPQLEARRVVIDDIYTSKNQLRIEATEDRQLRVTNLSQRTQVDTGDDTPIAVGGSRLVSLPAHLSFGMTRVTVEPVAEEQFDKSSLHTISQPSPTLAGPRFGQALGALGDAPAPEKIASWLETVITLQQTAADAPEFHAQTARALVELVELDLGLVMLYRQESWSIAASYSVDDRIRPHFSRTLLRHVRTARRTFYQESRSPKVEAESLKGLDLDCVVVSPIFGLQEEVIGVLYGMRRLLGGRRPGGIRPLDAQIVQLLAAAVGANLVRTQATRTRVQFEQFFSPELVRELERDPELLEGRNQEVTILVSDLRGFTSLSERLGPQTTCRVLRDLMERLSEQIVRHKGVIVDYAGDGILAMWNAPVAQEDHAALAGQAALAMLAELPDLNARWQPTVGGQLSLGIGINTGVAQVGNTGSTRKLKYGPHGLTVNLASRIQDATKRLGAPLLISSATRDGLPSSFKCRRLPPAALPGVTEPVVLFELQGEGAGTRPPAETLAPPQTCLRENG